MFGRYSFGSWHVIYESLDLAGAFAGHTKLHVAIEFVRVVPEPEPGSTPDVVPPEPEPVPRKGPLAYELWVMVEWFTPINRSAWGYLSYVARLLIESNRCSKGSIIGICALCSP